MIPEEGSAKIKMSGGAMLCEMLWQSNISSRMVFH